MGLSNNLENQILSFRHILKRSASIYESSGSQFFKTSTGILSGPEAFDEARFVLTFCTIFKLQKHAVSDQFQKGKQVKRYLSAIKIRVNRKVTSYFIRCKREHLWAVEQRRYSKATFENIISNLQKVPRAKFLGSNGLRCSISLCKFGRLKKPFATITSLSEVYFRFRRLFYW